MGGSEGSKERQMERVNGKIKERLMGKEKERQMEAFTRPAEPWRRGWCASHLSYAQPSFVTLPGAFPQSPPVILLGSS